MSLRPYAVVGTSLLFYEPLDLGPQCLQVLLLKRANTFTTQMQCSGHYYKKVKVEFAFQSPSKSPTSHKTGNSRRQHIINLITKQECSSLYFATEDNVLVD